MADHSSYLSRHRPICTVIDLIRIEAKRLDCAENTEAISTILNLCNEATDYAQRMSARLMEYKRKEVNGNA